MLAPAEPIVPLEAVKVTLFPVILLELLMIFPVEAVKTAFPLPALTVVTVKSPVVEVR
jgi:hypothetical protein